MAALLAFGVPDGGIALVGWLRLQRQGDQERHLLQLRAKEKLVVNLDHPVGGDRLAVELGKQIILDSLQRALEWNPHHRDYAYTLGLTAARSSRELSLEQLAYADNSLARAARIDPHDDRAQTERGNLMMRAAAEGVVPAESALRAALRRYEEALRRDPLNPRLYLSAGLASRRLGEFDRAREFAHSAAALEPNYLDAHLLAADASQQIGEIKAARRELDRFEVARRTLRGHRPRNRYEEDLVKYNDAVLRGLQESLK